MKLKDEFGNDDPNKMKVMFPSLYGKYKLVNGKWVPENNNNNHKNSQETY